MKYHISGGNRLSGEIRVSGNKNSVFPCVAAALLTRQEVILENIPHLSDTQVLVEILVKLGAKIKWEKSTLFIKADNIKVSSLPKNLMLKLRGSVVLVGALLGRLGRVSFYHPGGDIIGQRSINTHLEAFKMLGFVLKRDDLKFGLFFQEKKR